MLTCQSLALQRVVVEADIMAVAVQQVTTVAQGKAVAVHLGQAHSLIRSLQQGLE